MLNKKGQGLSLNVIIIAVLAILVLVIVSAFFLGGFSTLGDKVRGVFTGTTAGSDLDLSISTCTNLCQRAKDLDPAVARNSAYCTSKFSVDTNNNGKIEDDEKDRRCSDGSGGNLIYVPCGSVNCGG